MAQYLDKARYLYVISRDGQQAWDHLRQYPDKFFVVLADRIMPRLHGLDLLTRMKKASLDNIPLILMTGEASKKERCAAIEQGVYDFIYKPLVKELLLVLLKKIRKQSI